MFCRRIFIAVSLLFVHANFSAHAESSPAAPETNRQVFQVKGIVKEAHPETKSVVIQHEAVTNYMPAMTMPFDVKNTNELRGLQPGDAIGFQMIIQGSDAWIEHVVKMNTANRIEPPSRPDFRLVRDVDVLKEGDLLPEYHFTNELGQGVTTKEFLGGPFAFTFFFTQCPYPAFCPLMSANFKSAQTKLLELTNAPPKWHLLSISFDTVIDSPATLRAYGRRYNYEAAHWSFVTGNLTEITAIADQVGEYFGHDESGGVTHNLRTVVVDSRGRIQKILSGNKWTSDVLVTEMIRAGTPKP